MALVHTLEAQALIELQNKDSAIDEMQKRINAVPAEIKALTDAFEERKKTMDTAKQELIRLKLEKKENELKTAEKDEAVAKHQRELNMVKENNAFKALLGEIENDKKQKDEIETVILELLEKIDLAAVRDKALQDEVKKLEEAKNMSVSKLEAGAAAAREQMEAAKIERAGFAAKIGAEVMAQYEFIRSQKKGLAIAKVHEDPSGKKISCGGCNIALTPQKAVDVKRRDVLGVCDNCGRMLYLEKTVFG
ncbi:MAG: hypothetical protein A2X34_01145 [Elusimicrobia bacterium GWC2_51_8]|nr:MAG: hypothetical protein A2X33_05365 [Elusimicrobia bacterium GWA2_51_34]OGR58664.1 MAG: hypothetical protein A2X34_01145 [Elusimicrobia bacterium GWC2_51_8]OGR87406.1 MAG: hypothetical protein A2021_00415 [Elusimicrobia bacterium GWF2_52_66]HAF96007.1 hypothetical protein [Elusimicrobiota bacterium]HCE96995.1 hypothetical protein [Elusimicrobiota bacterium]